jgi:integrase
MLERLRYVTWRRGRKGKVRRYWQRPGYKLTRLPDNLIDRIAMVERLNNAADAIPRPQELPRDTIGGLIQRYRSSDNFKALAAGTVKYYMRYLREIEALGPSLPFASFTRQAVVDFIETYSKVHQRRQAAAVLKNLFGLARYYGIVDSDAATGLRLKTSKPRDRIWSDEEIDRWLAAAAADAPHMLTSFLLLQFTAQRPTDVLHMAWPHYSGAAIRLRQQKTGVLLDVPVHPVLRTHLDALSRKGASLTIITYRGRPVPYARFNDRFL